MRLPFLFLAATLCNPAFAAESREVYYQGFLVPQSIVPTFDKGYLLVYDFEKIDVYAPDGSPLYSVSAEVPNLTPSGSGHQGGLAPDAGGTAGTTSASEPALHICRICGRFE